MSTPKKTPQKYKIMGKVPSFSGFATKSAKPGETILIETQSELYDHKNVPDERIITVRGYIYNILATLVFPSVLRTFSSKKLPKDFFLYAVYIEMHSDEAKNRILINGDAGFQITCKLKNGVKLKKNDPVRMGDIDHLTSIQKADRDANAAAISLMRVGGDWFGRIDLVYNRGNVTEKIDRAMDFFSSAIQNFHGANMNGFYQSLWDSSELLAESLLLLHNQIGLKAPHGAIRRTFAGFCKTHQIAYFEDFEKISQIRGNARYGPPHPEHRGAENESDRLLQSTYEFLKFVLDFLMERQVSPSGDFQKKIDIGAIKPKKRI